MKTVKRESKNVFNAENFSTLARLPVGASARIVGIVPDCPGEKKFADVGLVRGAELTMHSRAPFGGLLRIDIMQTSMALHASDAKNILIRRI